MNYSSWSAFHSPAFYTPSESVQVIRFGIYSVALKWPAVLIMIFLFLHFWCFDIMRPDWHCWDCPFETVKDIPVRMPFKGNLTNSEPISTPTPALTSTFTRFLHSRPLFPFPNHTRARLWTMIDTPYPAVSTAITQTSQSYPSMVLRGHLTILILQSLPPTAAGCLLRSSCNSHVACAVSSSPLLWAHITYELLAISLIQCRVSCIQLPPWPSLESVPHQQSEEKELKTY